MFDVEFMWSDKCHLLRAIMAFICAYHGVNYGQSLPRVFFLFVRKSPFFPHFRDCSIYRFCAGTSGVCSLRMVFVHSCCWTANGTISSNSLCKQISTGMKLNSKPVARRHIAEITVKNCSRWWREKNCSFILWLHLGQSSILVVYCFSRSSFSVSLSCCLVCCVRIRVERQKKLNFSRWLYFTPFWTPINCGIINSRFFPCSLSICLFVAFLSSFNSTDFLHLFNMPAFCKRQNGMFCVGLNTQKDSDSIRRNERKVEWMSLVI